VSVLLANGTHKPPDNITPKAHDSTSSFASAILILSEKERHPLQQGTGQG
jgi:hypothetical protein